MAFLEGHMAASIRVVNVLALCPRHSFWKLPTEIGVLTLRWMYKDVRASIV